MGKTFAKIVSLLGEWSVCTYGIFGPYGVGEIQIYQDGIFCPDFGTKKIPDSLRSTDRPWQLRSTT